MKSKPNITQLMGNSEVPPALESTRNEKAAFTRIELLAILVALALLAALALPVLATSTANSQIAQCLNNLRQIGHGMRVWAGDHNEQPPWLTLTSDGGTRPSSGTRPANAWPEYLLMSNQLVTPRILACPADEGVKVASDWSTGPNGLANPSLRASAISYGIGLHTFGELSRALLSWDRNVQLRAGTTSCGPAGATGVSGVFLPDPSLVWTNGVHGLAGHLLLNDGSVRFVDSAGLQSTTQEPGFEDAGNLHLFRAR